MSAAAWVLVLFAYGSGNAMTTAYFSSEQACNAAGQAAVAMTTGTMRIIKYTCSATGLKERT